MTANSLLGAVAFQRGIRISVYGPGSYRVRRKGFGRKLSVNLIFWEDGTITRGDVRLDLAVRLTRAKAAKMLGVEGL